MYKKIITFIKINNIYNIVISDQIKERVLKEVNHLGLI